MWDTLRRFFRSVFTSPARLHPEDLDEALTPLDVDQVKDDLSLREAAHRNGSENIPAPGDAALDGPQQKIRQLTENRIAEAFRLANEKINSLNDAIRSRDIDAIVNKAEGLPDEIRRKVRSKIREAQNELNQLEADQDETRQEIARYKERYDVARNPDLRDKSQQRILIAATLGLALVQAAANGVLFGQGMRLGLSAGLITAILLGAVDVGFHLLAGYHAVKVRAPDGLSRFLGSIFALIALLSVPIWSLTLVHLRGAIRQHGFDQGMVLWRESLLTNPFGFTDFISYALFIIGFICSSLAVATGWEWDEYIPLFKDKGSKLKQLTEDINYWQRVQTSAAEHGFEEGQHELNELYETARHNLRMMQNSRSRIRTIREQLSVFTDKMEHAYRALIQFYRDENRIARSEPAPDYFKNEPEIEFEEPLDVNIEDLSHFVEAQQQKLSDLEQNRSVLENDLQRVFELVNT